MLNNLCSELFPLSFENPRYLQGLGINYACELTANHFSGGYFEFFLSDEEVIPVNIIWEPFMPKPSWIKEGFGTQERLYGGKATEKTKPAT